MFADCARSAPRLAGPNPHPNPSPSPSPNPNPNPNPNPDPEPDPEPEPEPKPNPTQESGAIQQSDLWRGMRNAEMPDEFLELGGTELAPMSTTTSLDVAMQYCASKDALILRLNTASFMERGAHMRFQQPDCASQLRTSALRPACRPGCEHPAFPPATRAWHPVRPIRRPLSYAHRAPIVRPHQAPGHQLPLPNPNPKPEP